MGADLRAVREPDQRDGLGAVPFFLELQLHVPSDECVHHDRHLHGFRYPACSGRRALATRPGGDPDGRRMGAVAVRDRSGRVWAFSAPVRPDGRRGNREPC
ncbi:hypothetical protein GCM10010430_16650 [Kitasatospora cystarginea]|uniref:Uncharacterized protein n=1 Tax=Kitasatospora cystarginea TaxID=58350 RepID=A0ABP5QJ03_9ACTN